MVETNAGDGRFVPGNVSPGNLVAVNRLVLLAAVPLFLVLALVAYLTIQFAVNERAAQGLVRHSYQVMEAARQLQNNLQIAESSQRGYLIDRDPVYYQAYLAAAAKVPGDIRAFRDITRDNPSQQRRADRLRELVSDRLRLLAANIALAFAPRPDRGAVFAGLERGRVDMDAIRSQLSGVLREELDLLAQRDRQRRDTENLEIAFAIGAGVLSLGIMLMAAALLVRNNVSLTAAEQARANEAAIVQATLETVREGIAYFTSAGALCAFNARFFALLDLPADLSRLQTPLSVFQKIEASRSLAGHIFEPPTPIEKGSDTTHIVWNERELDIYKAPVSTGGFIIGVADQTDRKRAESMARQAQKMEAIGHLTGGVAHDFNNLLQIINANLDLAAAAGTVQADPRLAARLQNAIDAVTRGSRLTGQLLAFARRQALEPRSVDLGRVIRDMSDMLRRTLGEKIQVETVIAGGLWNTLADPNQVENTVLNLAINGRDAMPDGGKLTLEVANAFLDDAYAAAHNDVAPGQYVMLAVSDTGSGMAPDVLGRVFEPFFTTKPEGQGTGLGLAQTYGFVKQSGGHIKIYTEVGHGTTIKLYLPRTRREADAPAVGAGAPAQGGSEHILVVEDDEGVRTAVVDMLAEMGYRVSHATDAEKALELLKSQAPDLIFTDVVMPGAISTRDFTRRASAMHPGVHILYTSGYTQNAIVHNGKLDDDALLLSKPYRKDELARKLRGVFAGTARGAISPPLPARKETPRRGKVLVVEDVALIRMTTVDMVEQLGFAVCEAADGPQALAVLGQDGEVEVLLTDLGLPGMDGRQLVEEALRLKPSLKVIIASGYSVRADDTKLAGVAAQLTKPFDLTRLKRALEA